MGKRRAVGATLVSAVLFSSLVVSSAVLLSASEGKASSASLADGESSLYANGVALQGVAGVELLAKAQAVISSRTFTCSNGAAETHEAVAGLSVSEAGGGVTFTAAVTSRPVTSGRDNLTILGRFDGGPPGDFDLVVGTAGTGSYPGGRVTFAKAELHVLNLPFNPSTAPALCVSALKEVAAGLSFLPSGGCNVTEIASVMQGIAARFGALARSEGLQAFLAYTVDSVPSCTVSATVRVAQQGIAGPDGPFSWTVAEAERLP